MDSFFGLICLLWVCWIVITCIASAVYPSFAIPFGTFCVFAIITIAILWNPWVLAGLAVLIVFMIGCICFRAYKEQQKTEALQKAKFESLYRNTAEGLPVSNVDLVPLDEENDI